MQPFRSRTVARLAAEILHVSEQSSHDVFFLHGLSFHKECFRPLMRQVAQTNPHLRNLIAFDLPLHGDSEPVAIRTTDDGQPFVEWSDLAHRVGEAVRAWRAEQSVNARDCTTLTAFAHSMSGALCVQLSIAEPTLFDSLFLLEPIVVPPPFTHKLSEMPPTSPAVSALKRRHMFASESAAWDFYAERPDYAKWTRETLRLYIRHGFVQVDNGGLKMRIPRETQAALYCGGQDTRLFAILQRPTSFALPPVTLLSGETSFYNKGKPTLMSVLSASFARHASLFEGKVLSGLGHMLVFESDEQLAALFREHVQRNVRPREAKL